MSTALDSVYEELFREVILEHSRKPRNRGTLAGCNRHAEGMNPVCGDEITMDLLVDEGIIGDIAFAGQGCSISQASASMLTERVKGRSVDEAQLVTDSVRAMLTRGAEPATDIGDLDALRGVARFPARVKCALLGWNVLEQGIRQPTTTPEETP